MKKNMKFKEFEVVRVLENQGKAVKKGDIGAVIALFNKAHCTLLPNELEKVK